MPFALASCSDDDENSDEGQSDYLEITLNGKHTKNTYRYSDMCFSRAHKPTAEVDLSH